MQEKKLNLKEPLSPEEIQAQFWADFGNAALNSARFLSILASQNKEIVEEMAAIRTEMQDFNANFRTFLTKTHGIPPDELDGFGSNEPEEDDAPN